MIVGGDDHLFCEIDIIEELMNRGFTCYLEHEITDNIKNHRIFVDIYAKKKDKEIIVEVGTCSHLPIEYKQFKPNAKLIFVHQWKNYGINESRLYYEWLNRSRFIQDCHVIIRVPHP